MMKKMVILMNDMQEVKPCLQSWFKSHMSDTARTESVAGTEPGVSVLFQVLWVLHCNHIDIFLK